MNRQEQLEAELAAHQSLNKIEERRRKSLVTNVSRVNEKYDELRKVALQAVPEAIQQDLAKTDEAHQAYLVRQQQPLPVADADIEVVTE